MLQSAWRLWRWRRARKISVRLLVKVHSHRRIPIAWPLLLACERELWSAPVVLMCWCLWLGHVAWVCPGYDCDHITMLNLPKQGRNQTGEGNKGCMGERTQIPHNATDFTQELCHFLWHCLQIRIWQRPWMSTARHSWVDNSKGVLTLCFELRTLFIEGVDTFFQLSFLVLHILDGLRQCGHLGFILKQTRNSAVSTSRNHTIKCTNSTKISNGLYAGTKQNGLVHWTVGFSRSWLSHTKWPGIPIWHKSQTQQWNKKWFNNSKQSHTYTNSTILILTCWSFSLRSESSFSVSLSFLVASVYWLSRAEARPASVLTSDFILLMYRRATVNSSSSFSPAPGLGCSTKHRNSINIPVTTLDC